MLATLLFSLSCMTASVLSAPFPESAVKPPGQTLTVVDPLITSPTADTVWVVGNQYNVTWYVPWSYLVYCMPDERSPRVQE